MARLVPGVLLAAVCLAACGGSGSPEVNLGKKIAFLLPDSQSARYEKQDAPLFAAKVRSLCSDCTIDYRNAHGDASAQLAQAESALAGGAGALVIDPVDPAGAAAIVARARARQVPVIAYDRLVLNAPAVAYFASFDGSAVGRIQADGLLVALKGKVNPTVVMINGDPGDNIARLLKVGVENALSGKVAFARTYDTPPQGPDNAQTEMADALVTLHNVDAVYAADDASAGGAVAALSAAGLKPLPPVIGAGAELAAVQRILAGRQYMTVYKSIREEAESAAQLAYDLVYGVPVPDSLTGGKTVDNGGSTIPALLVSPVAVTRPTVVSTVIADGYWTKADLCVDEFAAACAAVGIS